jgi:hypothetical protein
MWNQNSSQVSMFWVMNATVLPHVHGTKQDFPGICTAELMLNTT